MNYDEFVAAVSQRGGLSHEQAEVLARATLETLAELVTADEIEDLAAQLPKPLRESLRPAERTESFGIEEFVRRVSERAKVPSLLAAVGVRAVLTTMREAVSAGQFEDVLAHLPDEYSDVIGPITWRGCP